MKSFRGRGAIGVVSLTLIAATSATAHAATVPPGSVVRIERTIDTAAFTRLVATRFQVQLRQVVTADIDRDGDLDVVAATDRGVLVWVNDGAGRLTSQSPNHTPVVDGSAPGDIWQDGVLRDNETIQNDLPSPRLSGEYAHAPPSATGRSAASVDFTPARNVVYGASAPRAPPRSPIVPSR